MVEFEVFVAAALDTAALITLSNEHPDWLRYPLTPCRRQVGEIFVGFNLQPDLLDFFGAPKYLVLKAEFDFLLGSCLCTLNLENLASEYPRIRPVQRVSAQVRCHYLDEVHCSTP